MGHVYDLQALGLLEADLQPAPRAAVQRHLPSLRDRIQVVPDLWSQLP